MAEERLDKALSPVSTESTAKAPRKRDEKIRTYYTTPELLSRMERLKEEWGVGESELTRWLIEKALGLVDKGKLKRKTETETRTVLE